jgi:putative component of membrane protein insertase Oxa1/YidC/SpoIIIJ protein YidD
MSRTLGVAPFLILGLLLSGFGGAGRAEDRMRAPVEERRARVGDVTRASDSAVGAAVGFFRTTISPVDGNRCPMYPTCSQYGEQALQRHGPFVGILLLVDRLFHEWSETATSPKVTVHGVKRSWDPLEANDFWFSGGGDRVAGSELHGETR